MLEAAPTSNGAKTASSGTDPLLAKAAPAVEVPLGEGTQERGKAAAQQQWQPERGVRTCERNSPADTQIRAEEGGRRCSRCRS